MAKQSRQGIFASRGDLDGDLEKNTFEFDQFISFRMGQETYLIAFEHVTEIFTKPYITPVPKALAHIIGVINVRGEIVPVLNLRTLLELKSDPNSEQARVLLTKYEQHTLGILVDQISHVVNLNDTPMEASNLPKRSRRSEFTAAVTEVEGHAAVLLDYKKIIEEYFLGEAEQAA